MARLGRCCSVEVGCGTGDVILSLAGDFKHSLGLDINDGFLSYAKEHTPERFKDKVWCGLGACMLYDKPQSRFAPTALLLCDT